MNFGASFITEHRGCLFAYLGNLHFDLQPGIAAGQMHPAFNDRVFSAAQVHIVLVDESLRHLDKRNRAGKASIVPPIGLKRGNIVLMPRVIYRGHHKVGTRMNHGCDVAVETGEPYLVLAHLLPVYLEQLTIIRGADMPEAATVVLAARVWK